MRAKDPAGPAVSATAVQFNEWLISLKSGHQDPALEHLAADVTDGKDTIEQVAEFFLESRGGIERKLLSKSLQEVLYYSSGFDIDIDYDEVKSRVTRFIARRGAASLVKRFLALYFFNYVWFETSESFRAVARTPDSFEKLMAEVELKCQRAVAAAWKSFEKKARAFNRIAAAGLVQDIERILRRGPRQ